MFIYNLDIKDLGLLYVFVKVENEVDFVKVCDVINCIYV